MILSITILVSNSFVLSVINLSDVILSIGMRGVVMMHAAVLELALIFRNLI